MSTLALPAIVRGATLDIAVRIPDGFADGYFAGWVPTSQLRNHAGVLIATLQTDWIGADTRYLRLRAADTSAWPVGPARFDVRLTAPDGYKLQSTLATMQITMGATQI